MFSQELIDKIYNQGSLAFYWRAYRKDDTILNQFNTTEIEGKLKENQFTEVDKSPEKFKRFELVSLKSEKVIFSVNLENGDFILNGVLIKNNLEISDYQLRCIFWRRKKVTMNVFTKEGKARYQFYTLGWQTTINNKNIKKEYIIFPDFSVQEVFSKQKRGLEAKAKITN